MLTKLEGLLPHRPPMLLLDGPARISGDEAETTVHVRADHMFLTEDGRLDRVAFLEIMAQCFAAGAGARSSDGLPGMGYLAGVREMVVHGDAHVGETLTVRTRPEARLGDIVVVRGEICSGSRMLAEARFKIYAPSAAPVEVRS